MMKIGDRQFDVENDCYVMGILNVTPDSFSDGGKWNDLEAAKQHTAQMLEEGASIIDIGGESTRPGHVQISDQEEIDRVLPMIEMVKSSFDVPVSIDSYKSPVVEAALKAGADLVNDIWGLKYDRKVADLIAQYQVPCVLMHNREKAEYHNFLGDLCQDMRDSLAIAKSAGIDEVIADVLPDGKEKVISELQAAGLRVGMIGDGINDAPALARADVGMAMGNGIDVAVEAGDIVLLGSDTRSGKGLRGVVTALELSRAALRNIRENLGWAFGYNILCLPIAAGVLKIFGGPSLSPMIAGAAMAFSSVSVVLNALRLRRFGK